MVRYYCQNCRYSWTPKNDPNAVPKRCPYCSRSDQVAKEKTADQLLNEITGD